MSRNTASKYYNFMVTLYNEKEFNASALRAQYAVSSRLMRLLKEANYIKKEGNVTRWIGDVPTLTLANTLVKQAKKESRIEKAHIRVGQKQMTITPIRKVPVDNPQPIVKEAEYDTSNSKIILILAVGAIVGFMIATIIWK
jgi:hypothetical protein